MTELHNRVSKVNPNCTYSTNYWAPLQEFQEEENNNQMSLRQSTISNISNAEATSKLRSSILAWINQRMAKGNLFRRHRPPWCSTRVPLQILSEQKRNSEALECQAKLSGCWMDQQSRQHTPHYSLLRRFLSQQGNQMSYLGCRPICL
jgi:hypothetical protein